MALLAKPRLDIYFNVIFDKVIPGKTFLSITMTGCNGNIGISNDLHPRLYRVIANHFRGSLDKYNLDVFSHFIRITITRLKDQSYESEFLAWREDQVNKVPVKSVGDDDFSFMYSPAILKVNLGDYLNSSDGLLQLDKSPKMPKKKGVYRIKYFRNADVPNGMPTPTTAYDSSADEDIISEEQAAQAVAGMMKGLAEHTDMLISGMPEFKPKDDTETYSTKDLILDPAVIDQIQPNKITYKKPPSGYQIDVESFPNQFHEVLTFLKSFADQGVETKRFTDKLDQSLAMNCYKAGLLNKVAGSETMFEISKDGKSLVQMTKALYQVMTEAEQHTEHNITKLEQESLAIASILS